MWIADQWKDYEVIDCSQGEKLERWGKYILLRPDPQVIWSTPKTDIRWKQLNAHYHRSAKGGGEWEFFDLPKQWDVHYGSLTFHLKPFSFKHTGIFPEQAVNWDWIADQIKHAGRPVRVLNLFAYTGGATLAAAKAGAEVTHVDASKGMVTWAKENAQACGLENAKIRWLVDDCKKFVEPLIQKCTNILSKNPLFYLVNSYTTGLQPAVLAYMLGTVMKRQKGVVDAQEIGIPVSSSGLILPCGASGRWSCFR